LFSNIDPDDEFLNSSKSYSLIESVSLNQSSFSLVGSQASSEYSILSGSKIHSLIQSMASFREVLDQTNEQHQSSLDLNSSNEAFSDKERDISSQLLDLSRCSVI